MNSAAANPGPFVATPWLRVSDRERDGVITVLQDAYAEGRLDDGEFDGRVNQALAARTYGELQLPLGDLVRPARPVDVPAVTGADRCASMLVHLSGYLGSFLVPLIIYLVEGRRETYLREQTAQAANFQITCLLANVGLGVLTAMFFFPVVALFPVLWTAWFVLVLVGGVSSAAGVAFKYPLTLRMLR